MAKLYYIKDYKRKNLDKDVENNKKKKEKAKQERKWRNNMLLRFLGFKGND